MQVLEETRRGHQIPWRWGYRKFKLLCRVLGIEIGSSAGALSAESSLQPFSWPLYCKKSFSCLLPY